MGGDGREFSKLPLDIGFLGGDQAANLSQDEDVAVVVGVIPDEEDGDLLGYVC